MGKFVKAASAANLPPGSGTAVDIGDKSIAVFNVNGAFYAVDNTCQHAGGPLGEGSLEGKEVTCPWHGWTYDVTTGDCLTNPSVSQGKYNVKVEDGDILVEV